MGTKVVVRHTVRPKTSQPSRSVNFNTTYRMNTDGTVTETRTRSVKNNVRTS